jgi:exopolysaccharide biosynthesis polyprenyl glycosylphosphotransferase
MRAEVVLNETSVTTADYQRRPLRRLLAVVDPASLRGLVVAGAIAGDVVLVLATLTLFHDPRAFAPEPAATLGYGFSALTAALVASIAIALLASRGWYDFAAVEPWSARLYTLMSSVAIALTAAALVAGMAQEPFGASAAGAAVAIPVLLVWRHGVGAGYAAVSGPSLPRRAIVVGAGAAGQEAARALSLSGHDVVGYVDDSDVPSTLDRAVLGPIGRLDEIVERLVVDDVVIALPPGQDAGLRRVLTRGFPRTVQIKYAAELGEIRLPRDVSVRRVGQRQYIEFASVAPVGWAKRPFDVAVAAVALCLALPLFATIAVAIKLESAGPVFYRQVRIGKDRKTFRMLKFRSMRRDADRLLAELRERNEVSGPMFKIRRDPRITRVGRFLRRFSLDELPQLLNVLAGEMSLVGPRPPLANEVEQYEDWEIGRLRAMPGITGLWQVRGRSDVPFEQMVRLDLHYVRNWSFALDLEILLRTIPAILSRRGAY